MKKVLLFNNEFYQKYYIRKFLYLLAKEKYHNQVLFACIGTPLSYYNNYFDIFGPVVGHLLQKYNNNSDIHILGTINAPIHAKTLEYQHIIDYLKNPNYLIIGLDACIDINVNRYLLWSEGFQPGLGVDKDFPKISDGVMFGCTSDFDPTEIIIDYAIDNMDEMIGFAMNFAYTIVKCLFEPNYIDPNRDYVEIYYLIEQYKIEQRVDYNVFHPAYKRLMKEIEKLPN